MIFLGEHINAIRWVVSSGRPQSRFFACALLLFSLFSGVYALGIMAFPAVQDFALQRFHLKPRPFFAWAALQVIPAMYSFENFTEYSTVLEERPQDCPVRTLSEDINSFFSEANGRSCYRVPSPHYFWPYPAREFVMGHNAERRFLRVDQISKFRSREQRSTLVLELGEKESLRGRLSVLPQITPRPDDRP